MNDMRKLMEAVSTLNESVEDALRARIAQGDAGAKELEFAIKTLQTRGDDDEAVDAVFDAVTKVMPEIDVDGDEFWDALYSINLQEEVITEYSEDESAVEELEYIQEQMLDLLGQAGNIVSGTSEAGSAQAYWLAHIETALSNDHGYLGGSMTTMQDTIDALRQSGNDDEDDDGSWEAAERANR